MFEAEDYRILVLPFLSYNLHDTRLFLVYCYPVGIWYTNQDVGAPDQAVTLIFSKGLARLWVSPRVLSNVWWDSPLSGKNLIYRRM